MSSKQLERIYVGGFLRSFPEFQVVGDDDRESPDFILRDQIGPIGLEVVRIFRDPSPRGSSAKRTESCRQRVLDDLAEHYYAAGGRPLMVTALMPGTALGDLDELASRLRRRRPAIVGKQIRISVGRVDAALYLMALPPEAGAYRRWQCASNQIGWVRRACEPLIRSAIAAKARKLAAYRTATGRVALLVVADATRRSGMIDWPPSSCRFAREGFDAVYFYRHPEAAKLLAP
jgi:hypothetical protein